MFAFDFLDIYLVPASGFLELMFIYELFGVRVKIGIRRWNKDLRSDQQNFLD